MAIIRVNCKANKRLPGKCKLKLKGRIPHKDYYTFYCSTHYGFHIYDVMDVREAVTRR